MHDLPECLNRRYKALDELINELTSVVSTHGCKKDQCSNECNDVSIKLMCEFWNILKEDPDCNLPQAVRQRMGLDTRTNVSFKPQRLSCYMAEQEGSKKDEGAKKKICCMNSEESGKSQVKKSDSKSSKSSGCCSSKSISPRSTDELLPLSKVLCNLKEAVSFDKKCNARICELVNTQKQLQEQIQQLEEREKEGVQLLKEAECMWSCMEGAYKNKIKESLERQSNFLKQMKEIETSNTKWRKNKKDLEFQIQNVDKCCTEIKEKLQSKTNDINCIRMEIDNFKKRIANNIKQIEVVKKSFANKKKASDAKTASLSAEMTRAKKVAQDEQNYKREKEKEGSKYIREAREDLQKIYRLVLEKKLENEDLRAEKETLLQELDLLKKSCEQCKDKCKDKEKNLTNEITKINAEIAGFKVRCIKCHECTDTADVRKFCVDCPRCAAERECLYKDNHCYPDTAMDCVCMSTKQKFMDNVFDNMYSLLERKTKTPAGKAVANAVLECMKKSRNGKLNEPTRKILQEFILTTVKKNLNLTVVGGAVKTRCEMDPDTYNRLMLCLNMVQATKPGKEDKGTVPKKEPCTRWGGTSECNCPKGPKGCICTKKGLPDPEDPESCPNKDKDADEVITCPKKETASCGVECSVHGVPSAVGKEVASCKPEPCNDKKCTFPKNMRAAQCILGPDSLTMVSKLTHTKTETPIPGVCVLENQIVCKCGSTPTKPCACRTDIKSDSRQRIIEEVMGKYTDVTPIEKVMDEKCRADFIGENQKRHVNFNSKIKDVFQLNVSEIMSSYSFRHSSSYFIEDVTHEKKQFYDSCKHQNDNGHYKEHKKKILPTLHCSKKVFNQISKEKTDVLLSSPLLNYNNFINKTVDCECLDSSGQFTRTNDKPNIFVKSGNYTIEKDSQIQDYGGFILQRCDGISVKTLIKNFLLQVSNKRFNARRSNIFQWVTVESLLNEICTLTRTNDKTGYATENEIEINNMTLNEDDARLSNKNVDQNILLNSQNQCSAVNGQIKTTINYVYVSDLFEDSSNQSDEKSLANDLSSE